MIPSGARTQPVRRPPQYVLESEPTVTTFGSRGASAASGGGPSDHAARPADPLALSGSSAMVMSSMNVTSGCRSARATTSCRSAAGSTRPVGFWWVGNQVASAGRCTVTASASRPMSPGGTPTGRAPLRYSASMNPG